MSSVGEYRRGGLVQPPRHTPVAPQPKLTPEQTEAACVAVGALVGFSADVRDVPLNEALTRAAATLQAMLDDDLKASGR